MAELHREFREYHESAERCFAELEAIPLAAAIAHAAARAHPKPFAVDKGYTDAFVKIVTAKMGKELMRVGDPAKPLNLGITKEITAKIRQFYVTFLKKLEAKTGSSRLKDLARDHLKLLRTLMPEDATVATAVAAANRVVPPPLTGATRVIEYAHEIAI
ncbi:hypothetical protein IWW38_000653 [Coemansia aciculifera]|uniref:Uncharacterized protein n=1 Tax=Coemansia aciculifera TaxID=417176 RepID=A0ACC1M955_9FUNG|nr:hypothetical protein IWW38_000653 [Coemansia aciculifera]